MDKEHYICTGGCRGVSDKPGVCQTAACPKEGQMLEACDCEDKKHKGAHDHPITTPVEKKS